jgi:hypothetical protein
MCIVGCLPLQHERVGETGSGKGKRDGQDSRQLASRDSRSWRMFSFWIVAGAICSLPITPETDGGSTSKQNSHEKEILTYTEELQEFLDQVTLPRPRTY